MARVWRLVYATLESRPIVAAIAWTVSCAAAVGGPRAETRLIAWFDRYLVRSGWPHQVRRWTNLHMARLLVRVRRHRRRPVAAAPRTARSNSRGDRLRIGLVGQFRGLLCFPAELFRCAPPGVEVVVFDIPYQGQAAPYLEALVDEYVPIPMLSSDEAAYDAEIRRMAETVAARAVDVVLNVTSKRLAYDLLDVLDHPCIAHYCNESEPLFHERVSFQLFPQPEADYFVRDGRLFCATTEQPFSGERFVAIAPYYDLRGLELATPASRLDRDPLVTFHGSLYKLASPSYLDVLFGLLHDDPALEFRFMGKDDGAALGIIQRCARRRGLAGRVFYEGSFQSERDLRGAVSDQGWARMKTLLARARLQANPWPLGGGAARIEAYALGVPCVALSVSFAEKDWTRRQLSVCDVPAIRAPHGTASGARHYAELCRRCLYEDEWFATVVEEQRATLNVLTNGARWWADVVDACREHGVPFRGLDAGSELEAIVPAQKPAPPHTTFNAETAEFAEHNRLSLRVPRVPR